MIKVPCSVLKLKPVPDCIITIINCWNAEGFIRYMFWSACENWRTNPKLQLIRSTELFGGLLAGVQSRFFRVCVCCKLKEVSCRWDAGSYQTTCCVGYMHVLIRCLPSQYLQPCFAGIGVYTDKNATEALYAGWQLKENIQGCFLKTGDASQSGTVFRQAKPGSICKVMWRLALGLQCRARLVIN